MSAAYDPRVSISGVGDPVVLVPGMDGTGLLFYRQIPLLARSRRVATYALRDDARSMDELIADLGRVIEDVAPVDRRAVVIGESFGGTLALSLALARPEAVRALVILNSFSYFKPQIRLHLGMLVLRTLPWGTMSVVRRATAFRLHSSHTHRDEQRRFMVLTERATREGYLGRLRLLTAYDVRERLRELRVPVLFLAAEEDHLVPSVREARYMAARVPHAVVRVLHGHGHICLIAPDIDLGQILDEWLPAADAPL